MSGLPFDPIIIAVVAVVVILIGILASGYVKAPADKAYIISGLKKVPKVLIGRAGIKIPFLERKDELLLKQIGIEIKNIQLIQKLLQSRLQKIWRVRQCGISLI